MKLAIDIYKSDKTCHWRVTNGETGDDYENSKGTANSVEDALKLSKSWISDNLDTDEIDGIGFDIDHTNVNLKDEDVEEFTEENSDEIIIFTSVHKKNKFKSWDEYINSHKK